MDDDNLLDPHEANTKLVYVLRSTSRGLMIADYTHERHEERTRVGVGAC